MESVRDKYQHNMVDITRMGLTYIPFAFYMINFITAFNIDTKNPYIYTSVKDTYFGYSIAFNKLSRRWVILHFKF